MVKSLKFCLSLFALLALSNCQNPDEYKEYSISERKKMSIEYLENGEKNFGQGSPQNMELIEIAIKLDTTNAAAWRELSVPYLKRGIPHEWKQLFDKAVKIDPTVWQGWRGYLKLFFYRDYEAAIDDFNATDTLTPGFTDYPQSMSVDYLRGLAYFQLGDSQRALDYYTKYINEVTAKSGEDWVDVYAFIHRAIVFIKLNEYEKAITDLEKCLKYYSSSSDAYYHLAAINLQLGRKQIAKEQIVKAKDLFEKGYYMHRPYVETFGQIDLFAIEEIEKKTTE
ncbi:MAG: tetratricopeptide repeat protein [Cyclobacteriaceae bacterium]